MGKLVLYGYLGSPTVRTAALTLHELGLDFQLIIVDPALGEQNSEEYLKKNPQHTIPMLEDDDEAIWDSHAIAAYLVRKYGKTDALYPKDFYQRAVVDQRLHFESGVLFTRGLKGFMSPHVRKDEKTENVLEAYDFLEEFLADNTYMAGNHLTIADFSILTTVSTLNMVVPIAASGKTPKLSAWLELMIQLPYYEEINGRGLQMVAERLKTILAAGAATGDS